jgi:hypothetical protein
MAEVTVLNHRFHCGVQRLVVCSCAYMLLYYHQDNNHANVLGGLELFFWGSTDVAGFFVLVAKGLHSATHGRVAKAGP